jgi:hypothetical protein
LKPTIDNPKIKLADLSARSFYSWRALIASGDGLML